jgi:hypothetical protein
MRIVTDNNDWLAQVNELVADKDLRREMGRKAREYVIGRYAISENIHKCEEAYTSLL